MKIEIIMAVAITLARENNQVVGEKNDYYITIEQLEAILRARGNDYLISSK